MLHAARRAIAPDRFTCFDGDSSMTHPSAAQGHGKRLTRRAGRNLPKSRRATLERAKRKLREAFGRKP
ncbi:hypothetical protein BGV52_19550 [Burkholderia ubonensis]|uniref:Uncharacterized protein n=1 Tax=Burkholderia ubonensis TaxID=101571 RepID=A0A105AYJ7_9BURK|nr:hypothetical protein WI76_21225 [Burkholderia ubonensis]KVD56697.1 hypothetical protein WI87_20965 [Burkholderia ubonensis]KVG39296.1 hypothetical protein WJ31_10545 [Burkholderia ubonensis]KVO91426.1 hypothetical protein WJ81_08855 [Burkholderia ubonensis]KVP64625.1 hypothetical protein WJ90_01970 [Burkholderia ubonensis]